ncbi:3-ketosteroid-delta-1-dehydrogenase [Streptomyces sp. ID03-2B]|uniref:3-ketosteroid-delta-1-dehydrogenase n=1 Tax=Streptomyces caviscabies TaxID=90079 RepID=A0ABW2MG55_9ACTN|nr:MULTISPECIES: 3-ketosteroid-delta-1-dehydrogenase [unclassified Streptomyces]MCL6289155.1 3-ketosteroid-delta-1-dehydrogenase [Streptomyces sp. 43Y-GA-1]MDX3339025.1 3-ketosteroid-delta-1-dehydrogenase [Streptomyces sp. ME02-6979.5a]MDX3506392.1 3-ketosteroid-delta-1-dehydrogenase [Streptomyces sp. ATCC51928]MDX3589869.1 3-ketosteroid-delta-1-dehydrogenase [Streptomyces sp. ID03-2B]MDX5522239.1 3-ketosteroid-delta-1-dehydrogenase [Streptomyces sp. DE06-01C]
MPDSALAPVPAVDGTTVDLLVVGAGTGMAAALAGHEAGLKTLIVEKTEYVGGSTARSGGAFWIPASSLLEAEGAGDTPERARTYLEAVVGSSTAEERWRRFLEYGEETLQLLQRTTPMHFFWARGYADYHPELPGGSAAGRTCECRPFNLSILGKERARLRPSLMEAPVPMPITGADYRWMNLVARLPRTGVPRIAKRAAQGIGGKLIGREYAAGGQALAAGLYAGVLRAGIPVWTQTALRRLTTDGDRVTGAVLDQDGQEVTVTARRGVVLAAGGFDHDIEQRRTHQSKHLQPGWSLGSSGNTGDAIRAGQDIGADTDLLEQAWWFPAVAPLPNGSPPVLLAERALPGSLIVDGSGRRFINEATDYMSFGQLILERERAGDPAGPLWLVFDQQYRNRYVFAGASFPRMALPKQWYDAGIAHRADDAVTLARSTDLPEAAFTSTLRRFNGLATTGNDEDFGRGNSAYDRYYGDPTVVPNPNLRPLQGQLYAVRVVLSDLGTCGGLRADGDARVLRPDGAPIEGLYAIGNTAANAFGTVYPGAGATIGQGLVYATVAARHAAGKK